jgi:hypothetical protein
MNTARFLAVFFANTNPVIAMAAKAVATEEAFVSYRMQLAYRFGYSGSVVRQLRADSRRERYVRRRRFVGDSRSESSSLPSPEFGRSTSGESVQEQQAPTRSGHPTSQTVAAANAHWALRSIDQEHTRLHAG